MNSRQKARLVDHLAKWLESCEDEGLGFYVHDETPEDLAAVMESACKAMKRGSVEAE